MNNLKMNAGIAVKLVRKHIAISNANEQMKIKINPIS
jgi:hypothetical protein